jgi:hypothetical protein
VTLRDEHELKVFENGGLGKISSMKRDAMVGDRRKLQNKELHSLSS